MKRFNQVKKYGAKLAIVAATSAPVVSFAQTAQPDVSDATDYIAAGVATILAVFAGKYIIAGVIFLARKVQGALGR